MALVDQVKESGLVTNELFEMQSGSKIAAIIPSNFTDILNMSEVFFQSGMAPASLNSASKIAVAIQYGLEVGLPPMQALQNIAVVNGRPCLWGDALPALMYKHGHSLDEIIEGEGDSMIATCALTRGDTGQVIKKSFSMKQAKKAGLAGKGVWSKYPERMLQMRARGFAVRDGASDAMVGLAVAEEVQDYQDQNQIKNVTPPSPPSPEIEKQKPTTLIQEPLGNLFDLDHIKGQLDDDLSAASDVETLKEIWEETCSNNEHLTSQELEELNDTLNEHIERVG